MLEEGANGKEVWKETAEGTVVESVCSKSASWSWMLLTSLAVRSGENHSDFLHLSFLIYKNWGD